MHALAFLNLFASLLFLVIVVLRRFMLLTKEGQEGLFVLCFRSSMTLNPQGLHRPIDCHKDFSRPIDCIDGTTQNGNEWDHHPSSSFLKKQ
jgi:hypothetical protein